MCEAEKALCPEDVRRFLSGEVSDAALQRCLAVLAASREWTVFPPLAMAAGWVIQMHFRPTGMLYTVWAERVDAETWRIVPTARP